MMGWFWENIIVPVFKVVKDFLVVTWKWAFENPAVSVTVGTVMLVGSVFISNEELQNLVAQWGTSILVAGALGYAHRFFSGVFELSPGVSDTILEMARLGVGGG